MNGFSAYKLKGACAGTQYGNFELSGNPFTSMGMHIFTSTTQKTQPITEQAGTCNDNLILPWRACGGSAYVYGSDPQTAVTDAPPKPTAISSDLKFDYAEVSQWLPKKVLPPGVPSYLPYTITYEGPRFLNPSAFVQMNKVATDTDTVTQFKQVNWLDGNDPDIGQDWLGLLYPGSWMYTVKNMPKPFLAENYYEDSKAEIDRTGIDFHTHILPFCTPLKVYNKDGVHKGYCDCLAFIPFFSGGILKDPLDGLPIDIPNSGTTIKRLRSTVQYISMELWIYLGMKKLNANDSFVMKSPRIARRRYWFYTQRRSSLSTEGNAPFEPYMFLLGGSKESKWLPAVNFSVLPNSNKIEDVIARVALSNFGMYAVA